MTHDEFLAQVTADARKAGLKLVRRKVTQGADGRDGVSVVLAGSNPDEPNTPAIEVLFGWPYDLADVANRLREGEARQEGKGL